MRIIYRTRAWTKQLVVLQEFRTETFFVHCPCLERAVLVKSRAAPMVWNAQNEGMVELCPCAYVTARLE